MVNLYFILKLLSMCPWTFHASSQLPSSLYSFYFTLILRLLSQ